MIDPKKIRHLTEPPKGTFRHRIWEPLMALFVETGKPGISDEDAMRMLEDLHEEATAELRGVAGAEPTKAQLREHIEKLTEYANGLIDIVKVQRVELGRREALIRGAQRIIGELVKICRTHGIAIPDELMGGTVQ